MASFRILIVDDHDATRKQLFSYFDNQQDVSLVMEANNGLVALQILQEISFDIVVTDVIMPQMDGFTLMNHIKNSKMNPKPAIFVMSSLNRTDFISKSCELGSIFFFLKPFAPENLFFHIQSFLSTKNHAPLPTSKPVAQTMEQVIDQRISAIFMSIGIPPHLKGYQCLREAIKMVIEDHTFIDNMTKRLYPKVAEVLCTATTKVERSMRHAIEVAWNRGRTESLNEAFGHSVYITDDRPTNGEFIALIADKISLELNAREF